VKGNVMAFNFPDNPTLDQVFEASPDRIYYFNGDAWRTLGDRTKASWLRLAARDAAARAARERPPRRD